ncbi:MAG: hypothetical protein R3F59_03955 [Myxococcota bacterium]
MTLGDWLAALYDAALEAYGDEELASVIATTTVADQLLREALEAQAEAA